MELRHLRYFETVATELNFRRAAERLHVAQPALSRQIKDLEYELRVRLLDRDTTHVHLTDAGRVFLEETRRILAEVKRASEIARAAAEGRRGRLAIGNVGPITASFMPAALTRFRARFPDVAVTLLEIEPAEQITAVENGTIQVGFTIEKDPGPADRLSRQTILCSPLCAVVGKEHRFAGHPQVSLQELAQERMLCFAGQRSETHADLVRNVLAAHQLTGRSITIVKGFESLLAMIAGGQGVSLMPQHVMVAAADGLRVIRLKDTADDLVFAISAVWRDDAASPLARNFVRLLGEPRPRRPRIACT